MENKIKTKNECMVLRKKWQGKIVFTNGCFDILHAGHVSYLEDARACGDILIVGVNSDVSIKKLKGEKRPIINEKERMSVLAGLEAVSYVVLFGEDTPLDLIMSIIPDVLVKGGDWSIENIVGSEFVLKNNGEVKSLPFKTGCSTSSIIERINKIYGFA